MKNTNQALQRLFPKLLLDWNRKENKRQMPWKGEKDPYKIWLSEIILQQTRVQQGLSYYERFVHQFPDIKKLAAAKDQKVFKLWEGLGYYTRCRNLLATARYISKDLKGVFPRTYEEIKELKGIGPYTAAAISSFAYNLPHAVIDGNVFRVLSRVFGISTPIDSAEGKKIFTQLANELLDRKFPGNYNQALMDFGATVCKPAAPECDECIFRKNCRAFLSNRVSVLPVKEKRTQVRKRRLNFFILKHNNKMAIRLRKEKDIWQQLYEFPLVESTTALSTQKILELGGKKKWIGSKDQVENISGIFQQQLSHQLIVGRFITIQLQKMPVLKNDWVWVAENRIHRYAFPQLIHQWLSHDT